MSNSLPRPDIHHVFPSLTADISRCISEYLDAKTEAKCLMVTSAAYAQESSKKRLVDLRACNLVCLLGMALDSAPSLVTHEWVHPRHIETALYHGPSEALSILTCEVEAFVDVMLRANAKVKHLLCLLEDDPQHSSFLALPNTTKLLHRAHTMLCDNKQVVQKFVQTFLRATRQ